MLLHVGEIDRCRSDSETLAINIRAANGEAHPQVWPAMPHGFHGLAGVVPEADEALDEVSRFVKRHSVPNGPSDTSAQTHSD